VSRRTTIALCVLAGLALAGCGAGRDAQVLKEKTAITGVNVDLAGGALQVRDVYATPTDTTQSQIPVGGSASLHFHVYNGADEPELMVIGAPAELSGPGVTAGAVTIQPHSNVWVGGPTGGLTATIAHVPNSVFVGAYVPVTLSFNNAGHVNVTAPVEDGAEPS
jgi:hypothetical protein